MRNIFVLLIFLAARCQGQAGSVNSIYEAVHGSEEKFGVPGLDLGYRENLEALQSHAQLTTQKRHFDSLNTVYRGIDIASLSSESRILYHAAGFELSLHLERTRLGLTFNGSGRIIPTGGLYQMDDGKEWYAYFLKRFTGMDISAQHVMETGRLQASDIRREMVKSYRALGWPDTGNLRVLSDSSQFLYSKDSIIRQFSINDSIVRKNLKRLFPTADPPRIEAIEWPDAGPFTPPGMYVNKEYNAYGVDVFMYNFYGGRFPGRCLDWLYLHEAIPGHHLQRSYTGGTGFYFGTSEGWACYVEKLGSDLGLYSTVLRKLGEQEWDLVRSVRLVLDVGIHFMGWNEKEALKYWKENIRGQDDIALREIRRVTNWPTQAVCYKMGALEIGRIVEKAVAKGTTRRDIHDFILRHSHIPLEALSRSLASS